MRLLDRISAVSPTALRRQIGQLVIAGFNGHQIPQELRSIAKEFSLGGIIFFARNVADPEQVAEVAFDASRLVPDSPLWVSVDQEGGRVARLKSPFTEWPPMATLGRSGDEKLAERFAKALASELKTLAHPSSADTIPTSANREDHVSMSMAAALKAARALELATRVVAIEMLLACQAIDLLAPLATSPALAPVHARVRSEVAMLDDDRPPSPDIEVIAQLITRGSLEDACAIEVK